MKLIVAVDKNWAIGKDGDLLIHNPEDMQYFKEKTMGKTVVMGRKTLDSFPEGKPLQGRINMVLTRQNLQREGVLIFHSIEEIKEALLQMEDRSQVYIIGGEQIYRAFLEDCDTAYVTWMDYAFEEADAYFPNLDEKYNWKLVASSDMYQYKNISYCFRTYEKKRGTM
jgi:dihydrofolate reductase